MSLVIAYQVLESQTDLVLLTHENELSRDTNTEVT